MQMANFTRCQVSGVNCQQKNDRSQKTEVIKHLIFKFLPCVLCRLASEI